MTVYCILFDSILYTFVHSPVSGYEKSEKYKLTEIKLSKDRLLHKPPSLPDVNTPGKDTPSKGINTQDKVINNNQPPSNATQTSDSTNRYSLTAGLDIPFVDAGSNHSLGPGSTLSPSPDKANGSLLSRSSSDPGFKADEENSPKEKLLSKESEEEESDPFDESPILLNASRSPKLQKSLKHVDATFPVETKQFDILFPPQHKPANDNCSSIVKPTDGNRPHPSPASFDAHFASHVSHGPGHLHHPIRQGSVYERQMSVSSEESDEMELEKQLNARHRLYDIPEEAKDGNDENGELINTPAIIVKPRPVIKGQLMFVFCFFF